MSKKARHREKKAARDRAKKLAERLNESFIHWVRDNRVEVVGEIWSEGEAVLRKNVATWLSASIPGFGGMRAKGLASMVVIQKKDRVSVDFEHLAQLLLRFEERTNQKEQN